MRLILAFVCLCMPAFATDWLCTEESSQRRGSQILACGIGQGADENVARSSAFDAAKTEFGKVCQASDDCRGHEISVEPSRTACEKSGTKVKCYRLIVFTIGAGGGSGGLSGHIDKTEHFVPFRYEQIAALPKIKRGAKKARVLESFGKPDNVYSVQELVNHEWEEHLTFVYSGKLCLFTNGGQGRCYVYFNDSGEVLKYEYLNPDFTEDLK